MVHRITSRSNERLKELVKTREDYYFFEGEKLVEDILRRKITVDTLILHDKIEEDFPVPEKNVKDIWYVNDSVLKKLSTLKKPSECIAVLKLKKWEIDFRKARVVIGLDNIQDPANAGTVFRCAAAFGVDFIALSGASVRTTNPKFIRAAQDAFFNVKFQQFDSVETLIKKASRANVNIYLTSSRHPGEAVKPEAVQFPCLILMGNEGQGLAPELFLEYPSIKISQTEKVESLNAGVSACIIMHELRKLTGSKHGPSARGIYKVKQKPRSG